MNHTSAFFSHSCSRLYRWPITVALCLILAFLASPLHATSITVAGGQIIPNSAPGIGYVNDNNHPFPFMVFLPKNYSASNGPYPLVFCLHGNGEVGNGSSDGTLIASTANQLGYLFRSGPLPLIRNGSTYFGDKGVIVVQPQSGIGNGAAFNSQRVDLTMRHLLDTYQIDRTRIYTMGLSAGAGGVVRYAYNYGKNDNYQLATIIPFANIAGLGTTYTDFNRFAGSITWFINCSDDTISPVILGTGRIWSGYGEGFAGGISRYIEQVNSGGTVPSSTIKNRCLTTHPDILTIGAGNFNTTGTIPATQLSDTYTGSFDPNNSKGWEWVKGQTFTAGSKLQVTIRKGGGHSGWSQTMGSGSTPNLPFWDWLLAQRLGQTPTGYDTPAISGLLRTRPVDVTIPKPPYGYVDYLPAGYDSTSSKVWPVVIYLSNTSESGDGTDNTANRHQLYNNMVKYGPLYQVNSQRWDFPAIIIAPQVTTNWTKPLNVKNIVEYVKTNYRVDINRIYMTGQLEGANGALRYAVAYPADLAAILPIETSATTNNIQATAIRSLPIWAVHSFANPNISRTISIGWVDAITTALEGIPSDSMATYPGYGGSRNRFAVDSNTLTGLPINNAGDIIKLSSASLVHGSATIGFSPGTSFGSNMFSMWGGSDALPFTRITVSGESTISIVSRGYSSSLTITTAHNGATATADVTIQTPVGYTATAYRTSAGVWVWNRNQLWNEIDDRHMLTLFPYQKAENGWVQTWGNMNVWNWMFSQIRTISSSG